MGLEDIAKSISEGRRLLGFEGEAASPNNQAVLEEIEAMNRIPQQYLLNDDQEELSEKPSSPDNIEYGSFAKDFYNFIKENKSNELDELSELIPTSTLINEISIFLRELILVSNREMNAEFKTARSGELKKALEIISSIDVDKKISISNIKFIHNIDMKYFLVVDGVTFYLISVENSVFDTYKFIDMKKNNFTEFYNNFFDFIYKAKICMKQTPT